MSKTVLIVVTHLLGTGHLTRALVLGRAFAAAGHEAHIASGGNPVHHADTTGITLHQLPALRSDGTDFARLMTPDGQLADGDYFTQRRLILTGLTQQLAPDILITELFPFGRRNLKSEFEALLAANPAHTRVFASVRDILAPPSKPAKADYAHAMIAQYYDGVLVHSDPDVIPLEASWPVIDALRGKLHYTGFVAPPSPRLIAGEGKDEILVSAGGGAVGDRLYETALEAARLDTGCWRLLVSGPDRVARLQAVAPPNALVEPARPDFREMLMRAAVSVSFCGYNTVVDLIQTGVPAVITPFDDGGEIEQMQRAIALGRLTGIEVLTSADLSPATLIAALDQTLAAPRRKPSEQGMQGAAKTVQTCLEFLP